MNASELLALFQAEEHAVHQALLEHGIIGSDRSRKRRAEFPSILRDVLDLSDDVLCDALQKHLDAGEDPEATPANYGITAFQRCFIDGKLAAMRLLLNAGAKTEWTADQAAIARGEAPASPKTGKSDPFLFACRVGNIDAAITYVSQSDAGRAKKQEAVIEAVKARATDIVAWLLAEGFEPNAVDGHRLGCA